MDEDDRVSDLTLLLMYLTSWEEASPLGTATRTWKGYDFDVLDGLEKDGLIYGSRKAKSVYLSADGIARAKELLSSHSQSGTSQPIG